MSVAELKISLIQKIAELDNPDIIEDMQRLIDFDSDETEMKLTSYQRSNIAEAREEYNNGNTLSETQANHEIEKWLNE